MVVLAELMVMVVQEQQHQFLEHLQLTQVVVVLVTTVQEM
jgi:hypothetical protein